MVVPRIRGCFGGGGLTPNAVGYKVGQESIKFLVGSAMETGNPGSTQYASVLLKERGRDGVQKIAIQHGVDNASRRAIQVTADDPGDNNARVHNVDGLRHRPSAPRLAVRLRSARLLEKR